MFTNCENHNYLLSPITTKAVNTCHDLLLTESLVVFGDLKWKTSQPACRLTANHVSSFLDNSVVVKITQEVSPVIHVSKCVDCTEKLKKTGIFEALRRVNFQQLEELSTIKALVSIQLVCCCVCITVMYICNLLKDERLHLLATSIRACLRVGYTNGRSKGLICELVVLVRIFGLCARHNLRLTVNVRMPMYIYI